jgi:hypothetical protein
VKTARLDLSREHLVSPCNGAATPCWQPPCCMDAHAAHPCQHRRTAQSWVRLPESTADAGSRSRHSRCGCMTSNGYITYDGGAAGEPCRSSCRRSCGQMAATCTRSGSRPRRSRRRRWRTSALASTGWAALWRCGCRRPAKHRPQLIFASAKAAAHCKRSGMRTWAWGNAGVEVGTAAV